MNKTDTEIWAEILGGSQKAWAELVMRYQPLVYVVCTRAGLSMADAADCFQQTWTLLYQNRHKVKNPARLSAWLVTTAKRESLRLRHRADRYDDASADKQHADTNPLPDEELELLERQAHLEIGLKQLDSRCRKVLEAFFFAPEDETYEQVAHSLGIVSNTLGPLRRRCLEKLKQILIKIGFLEERKDGPDTL